jgi:hypothetical protein
MPDARGVLTSIESGRDIPFEVRRVFFMHSVNNERGGHAHRVTQQLLLSPAGEFRVDLSDGRESVTYRLDDPNRALYLSPMTWIRLYGFVPGTVCLVLADTHYAENGYIRQWEDFLAEVRAGEGST